MESVKKVLHFIITIGNAMGKSLVDGKLGSTDLVNFLPVVMEAPGAFSGLQNFGSDLKSITPEQRLELVQYVKDNFSIPEANIEAVIERALSAGVEIVAIIEAFKAPIVSA